MKKKTVPLMLLTALVFGGLGAYFGMQAPRMKTADVGAGAAANGTASATANGTASAQAAVASLYAQSLPDAAGTMQKLAQWQGRPMLVNFWAPWCGPCVQEMPALSALQAELAPKHIQIIGIGIDSPSSIRDFAGQYKITYPLYVAGLSGTELSRAFGNQAGGLPYTVLISADGRVVKTYLGTLHMDALRHDLSAL